MIVDTGGRDVGVIVDAVIEVLRIPLSVAEPPSPMIAGADAVYLRGIAELDTKLIILLDLNKVLATIEAEKTSDTEEVETPVVAGDGKREMAAARSY